MNKRIESMESMISKKYSNIAGLTVLHEGKKCYEKYFKQCNKTSKIHVYSVTKSIVSILIGIAIDKGYIQDTEQKVLDFFPEYSNKKDDKKITIKDVLTMTVPYKMGFQPITYIKYFTSNNWVQFALNTIDRNIEVGNFQYAPIVGPDILSGILVSATGMSVLDFARENLFEPLNIDVSDNIVLKSAKEQSQFNKATNISGWVTDNEGINSAGWGLTLSTEDMAKIGQLYLKKGVWEDKRIVSSKWISTSTKKHSQWKKLKLDYGFLWWIVDQDQGIFAAMGDGGNVIYVNTEKELVVSITAMYKRNVVDRIDFIKEVVEPIFLE